MRNAFSDLKDDQILEDKKESDNIEMFFKKLSLIESEKAVKNIFGQIIRSNLYPEQKIELAKSITNSESIILRTYAVSAEHLIKKWTWRWEQHILAEELFARSGPHNVAVTVRFRRNYTRAECTRLTTQFFNRLHFYLKPDTFRGIGVAEPDKTPVQKNLSFHFHSALAVDCSLNDDFLTHCALQAASDTRDYREAIAIDVPNTESGRSGVHICKIYDERGWILYCTKMTEKGSAGVEGLLQNLFTIDKASVEFLDYLS